MCGSALHIISGPKEDFDIPNVSLGKIIFDGLRKKKQGDVLNVDAITGDTLTCGKLLEESIKLTTVFRNLGLEKDDAIAIISENTINYFVPVLAAWYLGIIVNPLNPDYKEAELKHCLMISKPKLVLCSKKALNSLLQVKEEMKFIETVLLINTEANERFKYKTLEQLTQDISPDVSNFKPEHLEPSEQGALILLSSGTTGMPKGVLLTHGNLRQALGYFSHPKYGKASSSDTTLIVLPFFHMFGLSVQLLTMGIQMKSVVMNKFKPDVFLKTIQDYKVTKLFIVPPLLLFLAKSPLVDNYDLSTLDDILVGGAATGKEVQNQAISRLGKVTIRQAYGLTETCGPCAIQTIDNEKAGSVGDLIPSIQAKIWDLNTKQNLGPLKIGELCFKGPMLMKGYAANRSATQQSIDEEGFYHSGDLGFYDTDGLIYITDRMSEVIKCKGFQISPAELEAIILTHPFVRESGVIGIPDERCGQVPLAFVVAENGASVTENDIIEFVAERISVQKSLRGGVKFVDEIPKTPSGKIIRRKLVELVEA